MEILIILLGIGFAAFSVAIQGWGSSQKNQNRYRRKIADKYPDETNQNKHLVHNTIEKVS